LEVSWPEGRAHPTKAASDPFTADFGFLSKMALICVSLFIFEDTEFAFMGLGRFSQNHFVTRRKNL
jgi:hypothetical protein